MPSSQTPVLAAIGAAVLGVSLAATGGTALADSSTPVPSAVSYVAEPADPADAADPAPLDVVGDLAGGGLVSGVLGNTLSGDLVGDVLKPVGVLLDGLDLGKLPEELLKLNPAPQTVDQLLSGLLP